MRKFLTLILIVVSSFAMAQDSSYKQHGVIKWNPGSLAFGKISIGTEWNYKHKKSVTFNIGIPANSKTTYELDGQDRDLNLKSFSLMGGYRMYLGHKDMTGFYFEPYLKYVSNKASTVYSTTINNRNATFDFTSDYSGFGIGGQLGVQFMIAKVITFDLFLLGPEANSASHKAKMVEIGNNIPWTFVDANDAKRELEDALKDVPIIGDKVEVTVDTNNKTVSSKYNGFLPGLRAGLSIGIRF
jgi:hypothetical protein